SLLLFIAFFSTSVLGHAYVQNVDIAGKNYTGWLPWTMPYTEPVGKSIVRNVPGEYLTGKCGGYGPILDITSADLACNQGGEKAAALIANVNAGDSVKLTWNTWPADHVGPVTVYMANCGGNCMTFNPTKGNVWFKIDEYSINSQGLWGTLKLIQQGDSWTVTIPPTIKAGQYLLRAELLALHNAGQPQFYPSCSQLNIASSGSSVPTSSDLVAIPGVYANAGKAINGDVWDNGDAAYPSSWPVAGPAV
ncbi:glycoside hydrolase, partial [Clavulina sp. PMI_390]